MGTEAYSVAVGIYLKDQVSQGLKLLSAQFVELGGTVEEFQGKLNSIFKLGAAGFAAFAAGMVGLHKIKDLTSDASDYAHQLNIMNMAGMKHVEIVQAISAAWDTTSKVLTSTGTGNLKTFMDLRNIFGRSDEATQYLPEMARIQSVLGASGMGQISSNSEGLVYSLAKALDIRGAVNNPAQFNEQAEAMAKVIIATQGRVLPQDYQQLFKYGRQAIPGLSNEFLYQELPTFMQQMKGGSSASGGFGVPLAAFSRFFVQGVMTKMAMGSMENLGLIPKNSGLKTTTTGTILNNGTHVQGVELAQTDPLQWVQNIMLPAIRKKYGSNLTNAQLSLTIADSMRGAPQTAIFATQQFALKAQQAWRDKHLIQMASDPTQAYNMAIQNDPHTAFTAFNAQLDNLKTQLGMVFIPLLLPTISALAKGLNDLVQVFQKYPDLTKTVALGFLGLSTALTGLGVVLMTAAGGKAISLAFRALGIDIAVAMAPFTGLAGILVSVGIAATGAYLAFKQLYSLYKQGVFSEGSSSGGRGTYIAAAGNFSTPLVAQLVMDGEIVGRAVMKRFGKGITQQSTHGSGVNADISLVPNMLNAQGYGI